MVFLPHFLIEFGGFSSIDLLSGFPPQFSTRLGGFSPAIWSSFETYQLLYKARMFLLVTRFSFSVSHHLDWEVFHQVPIQGFHSRFAFKVSIWGSHSRFSFKIPFKVSHQQISCSAELTSKEGGNCNNVTFGVEVMWELLTTTSPLLVWLSLWRLFPSHLCYRVGGTSIYKSERYSVRRVSGIIWDDKEGKESDDEDLGGWWWWMQSRVYLWLEY